MFDYYDWDFDTLKKPKSQNQPSQSQVCHSSRRHTTLNHHIVIATGYYFILLNVDRLNGKNGRESFANFV